MKSHHKSISILFLALLLVLILLPACGKKKAQGDPAAESAQAEDGHDHEIGQNVYNVNCASCHGPGGEGNGPAAVGFNPRNFKTDTFKNGHTMDGIKKTLDEGIPGTTMVSWKSVLSPEQLDAVAGYVRHLAGKE